MRIARTGGIVAGSAATVLAVGVLLLLAVGWRPVVVLSGSMGSAMPAGALVVVAPVAAADVAVGDVVTVVPAGGAVPVTHRVVELATDATGPVVVTLRGDANEQPDPQPVVLTGDVLVAQWVAPGVGCVVAAPVVRLLTGGVAVLGGLAGLWVVWRRP